MAKSGSSLKLNRAADYAIRAMIQLARLPENSRVMLPELARAIDAPVSFLSKILQSLCRAGMVVSSRGQSGGFEMLPAGRAATISSVIAAVDGPICLNSCLLLGKPCNRRLHCPAHPVWETAQQALLHALDTQTIAMMAALHAPALPDTKE
jgi:Rrf2 family protein